MKRVKMLIGLLALTTAVASCDDNDDEVNEGNLTLSRAPSLPPPIRGG